MRANPRLPAGGKSVTARDPAREILLLLSAVGVFLAVVIVAVGFLVDWAIGWIPPEAEKQFFDGLGEVLDLELSDDSEARVQQIRPVFDKLQASWTDAPYPFELGVMESDQPNAFAFPGGRIVVTTALLDMVKSENELALVLAHEMGHFKNRDHLRQLGRALMFNLVISAAMGSTMGGSNNELFHFVTQMHQGGFSRSQELKADRFGLELVHRAYGHVAGSWRFFTKLKDMPETPSKLGSYFTTHPHPENRIEKLESHAKAEGWSTTGTLTPFAKPEPVAQ